VGGLGICLWGGADADVDADVDSDVDSDTGVDTGQVGQLGHLGHVGHLVVGQGGGGGQEAVNAEVPRGGLVDCQIHPLFTAYPNKNKRRTMAATVAPIWVSVGIRGKEKRFFFLFEIFFPHLGTVPERWRSSKKTKTTPSMDKHMFGDSVAKKYKERSVTVHLSEKANEKNKSFSLIQFCEFNLPDCLTVDYFHRHELSMKDYEIILKSIRQFPLLQLLALSKNLVLADRNFLSVAFVRVQSCAVTGSNHHHLIEQLLNQKRKEVKEVKEGRETKDGKKERKKEEEEEEEEKEIDEDHLVCPFDAHVPPLPVHLLTKEDLAQYPPPTRFYQRWWMWKGIRIVPREYYHGYLVMVKVIPRSEYESRYGPCKTRIQLPCEFLIQGQVFYDTEESFCFQTQANHLELKELPEATLASLKTLFSQ
jgi:hypothetical protein